MTIPVIVSALVVVSPLISLAINVGGIWWSNRARLSADAIANSKFEWIKSIEVNTASFIAAINDINSLSFQSYVDDEKIQSLEDGERITDLYHAKEFEVVKAGTQLKLQLLSSPNGTELISEAVASLNMLIDQYKSEMFRTPDLIVVAQAYKERLKEIEKVESEDMKPEDLQNLKKMPKPMEDYFSKRQTLLNEFSNQISEVIHVEWKTAFTNTKF